MVPSGTGNGSSDIVRVIYSILLFPVLLFSFILVFVIVTFWAEKKNTMVYELQLQRSQIYERPKANM